jgi:hypothetical protein
LRDIDIVTISATDAKDAVAPVVAKAMHVRYLVSGSIQREGDAARVIAQLVDGGTVSGRDRGIVRLPIYLRSRTKWPMASSQPLATVASL